MAFEFRLKVDNFEYYLKQLVSCLIAIKKMIEKMFNKNKSKQKYDNYGREGWRRYANYQPRNSKVKETPLKK